jgi:hypothetical protein
MQKFSAVLTALLPLVVIGSLPGGYPHLPERMRC